MKNIQKRRGTITIDDLWLREVEYQALQEVFRNFIPVSTRDSYLRKTTEYWGYSSLFEEVDEGVDAPEYLVSLTYNHLDEWQPYSVSFVRADPLDSTL